MDKPDYWIDQTNIAENFKNHLNDVANNRILFSAPFGAGKSTFLNDFFESSNNNNSFNTIFLNPVNYSVAPNQDIFELIKFDIIDHLLKKFGNKIIEANDFNSLYILQAYIRNEVDFFRIATNLIKAIPMVAESTDLIENIKEEADKFFKYKDDINSSTAAKFKHFLDSFKDNKGSIYENDAITALINDYIIRLKEKTNLPLIMVIDDLDRLDPEHLFRILNVFSSHYHQDYTCNKFGIDKIIVVCDIKNVRQIFSNRYGAEVEFSGYIDKFYSTEIFHFDNRALFENLLLTKLRSIKYSYPEGLEKLYNVKDSQKPIFFLVLNSLVSDLIAAKILVLRSFTKIFEFNIPDINHQHPRFFNTAAIHFFGIINFLLKLFSTIDELISALMLLANNFDSDISMPRKGLHKQFKTDIELDRLYQTSLTPLVFFKNGFQERGDQSLNMTFTLDDKPITLVYELKYLVDIDIHWIDISHFLGSDDSTIKPNPYLLLIKAIQDCQKQGLLTF